MAYTLKGRLCGFICSECPEPLAGVKVRLYRTRKGQDVTALAVASPKDTFAILSDKDVRAKESSLIAEAATDAQGGFTIEIGENQQYAGEAFEVDVYCGTVPHRRPAPNPPSPIQFSITTIRPMWKRSEKGFAGYWEYCLPYRYWCAVRLRFGAWTICGRVTNCQSKLPIAGVKVRAFDVDWTQDDDLGFGVTDGAGKFRIDYVTEDFEKTPFAGINLECFSGPDLYFRIETLGGAVLLNEPRSRGRQPDRENVGNCFCVELCVDVDQPPPDKWPWFTNVGDFHIYADIDAGTGKTSNAAPSGIAAHGGPGFGFYDGLYGFGLKLIGFCPKHHPVGGEPMRYRFMYEHPANPGVIVPLTGGRISSVVVGSRPIMWDLFGGGPVSTFQSIVIAGSGATPAVTPPPSPLPPAGTPWGPVPAHVIVPDLNGWVTIDQTALDDGFYGPLIRFVSQSAVPGGAAPGDGPGNAPSSPKNGSVIKLYFEAEPVGGPTGTSLTLGNNLDKILINNWTEVSELNLKQFDSPGKNCCSPLSTALDIKYTADHELMRSWGVGISSCASTLGVGWSPTPPPLPGGSGPRGGFGIDSRNISTWPSCSYRVTLSTTRAVTDGETDDTGRTLEVTFCK